MAVKPLNALVGQNAGVRWAPDLTWLADHTLNQQYKLITAIDATGSLTTLLSLTGKFQISMIWASLISSNDVDQWKMTIDGVVIHNEDGMSSNSTNHFAMGQGDMDHGFQPFQCNASFLLEAEMTVDASFSLYYHIRPIL
jgi:hypothetical protein